MGDGKTDWLQTVYTAKDHNQLATGYDGWARDYDRDLMQFGYRLPTLAAGMIARHIPARSAPILDAGCGTGLLGEALVPLGYQDLDGLDLSDEMLAVARTKQIYGQLMKARLGDPLELSDDTYAAVVSIGTFTVGHAPPEGFDELIRVTRPGGWLAISIRTDIEPDNPHRARIEELESAGKWRVAAISGEVAAMPCENESVRNVVYVMQVSPN